MTVQRRAFTSLPAYLQTDRNDLELAVADDLMFEPEQAAFVSGFIGDTSKLTSDDLRRTPLLVENTEVRQKYQFSVAIAQRDPIHNKFLSGAFYDDLVNHLLLNGAITSNPDRLFSAYYYTWSPPIDYDKLVNPAHYVWTGDGDATTGAEYVTKEPAGSLTTLYQFDGVLLVAKDVTIVNGLPPSGATNQIVEDASTPGRFLYQWTGSGWGELVFFGADDTNRLGTYFKNDFVYVCRTGPNFNRPLLWVYRPQVGRWVSIPVVVSLERPTDPIKGMIWEDATVPPSRILRKFDGEQWIVLNFTPVTDISGTPTEDETYVYDMRSLSEVDSWSRLNWWRTLDDLSTSDKANLTYGSQGLRPIIEFWGNLEPAIGDERGVRNQAPLFNVYAVPASTSEIQPINTTYFPDIDVAALSATDNYVGSPDTGCVVSAIFGYQRQGGTPDSVLAFKYAYADDGTPQFVLEIETLPITGVKGYRFFKDTATGYVHCIWERTSQRLKQTADGSGLYSIPRGLKSNADHQVTTIVSRSIYINHLTSVISAQTGFTGTPYGSNSYRYTAKDMTLGATMIDPEDSLLRVMAVLQTNLIDLPDAIRQMAREYNKVMVRFVSQMNNFWNDGTLSTPLDTLKHSAETAVDVICSALFVGRSEEFPFYYSTMGTYLPTRISVEGEPYVFDPSRQPIYIPLSASQIGGAPVFAPQKFTDHDGIEKLRGHDGSLLPSFGDDRDDIMLELENRFYNSVPVYLKTETTQHSSRFNSIFHLEDWYGNYQPNATAGTVRAVVDDYTTLASPVPQSRLFSRNQQVYAIWNGTKWITTPATSNDVFFDNENKLFYIFNGFYANPIPTWNNVQSSYDYSVNEYRQVLQREFERWVVLHDLDFIANLEYDADDPFTWNYSSAGVEGNYRGIYRRIYHTVRPHSHPWEVLGYSIMPDWWLSEYPPSSIASDGTPRYVNTHPMWADFQAGIVNPISGKVETDHSLIAPIPVNDQGELLDPVAAGVINAQLLVASGLGDDWVYGDGSPVEETFYNSYYYPFGVALSGYLMKTAMFVERTWSEFHREIGATGTNLLWNSPHIVADSTFTRPAAAQVPSHLSLDDDNQIVVNPGLNAWIAEYTTIIGRSPNLDFNEAVKNATAVLGWKASGFINAKRTRVKLLNGDEIPNEDLSVVLHQGPSQGEYYQSGISVLRDADGYRVFGTDVLNPYFRVELGAKPVRGGMVELKQDYFYGHILSNLSIVSGGLGYQINDALVLVGGINSDAATLRVVGVSGAGVVTDVEITNAGAYSSRTDTVTTVTGGSGTGLRVTTSWTLSTRTFELSEFTVPPPQNDTAQFAVLVNGFKLQSKFVSTTKTSFTIDTGLLLTPGDTITASVVTAISNPGTQLGTFRANGVPIIYFQSGTGVFVNYAYGTLFDSINDVVNLMVGYGRWLVSEGWIFERLNNGIARDWLGAAKAFALWATDLSIKNRGNTSLMRGSIFEYSVMGRQTQFVSPFGMILGVERIRNGSYGIVDAANKPLRGDELDVVSTHGRITISSDSSDIFGLRLYVSEVQHVVFFPNKTTFADVIYEPALGLAQDTLVVDTYRSSNWNGRLEAPGFLASAGELYPNWEKQTNDITRYYDRFNPVDDPVLLGMARNMFGYVPKSYLESENADDRTQYNFFHGSLKSKGTFQNYKAFVRGTTLGTDNVNISEDWAWKFAKYGDRRIVSILLNIQENDFVDIFQVVRFDELSFSCEFTGDQHTTCFAVPRRFEPANAVVKVDGVLKVLAVDYDVTPTATGQNICFAVAPLRTRTISVSINDDLVHAHQEVYYSASASEIDTHMFLRPNNQFLWVNGLFTPVSKDNIDEQVVTTVPIHNAPILSDLVLAEPISYLHAFGEVGDDIFVQSFYFGDGFTQRYNINVADQNANSVIVINDGLWLSPGFDYTIDNTIPKKPAILLVSAPSLNRSLIVIATKDSRNVRSFHQSFVGDGARYSFSIARVTISSYRQVIVTLDGVVQLGDIPGATVPFNFTVTDGAVVFTSPPAMNTMVTLFVVLDAVAPFVQPIEDDRVIYVPDFSPPQSDDRWKIPPPQDIYRDRPFRFPVKADDTVDIQKYLFYGSIVDQSGKVPATNLFHWNPAAGLHEPFALSNVDYKTSYDPARYNNGPKSEGTNGLIWGESQVGSVWWDTSTAIYSDYLGYLPDFMRVTREWGRLKYFNATISRDADAAIVTTIDPKSSLETDHGLINGQKVLISGADQPEYNGTITVTVESSTRFSFTVYSTPDSPATGDITVQIGMIDAYEWVASPVPPVLWGDYIALNRGFGAYTGTVLDSDTPSFATREVWDVYGNATTTYYFWVQSNTRIITNKGISVNDIAGRLKDPATYEVPFLSIIDPATLFVFIGPDIVRDDYALELSYTWYDMPRHVEWMLVGENDDFLTIPHLITDKLVDSILGEDIKGNPVPNPTLSPIDQLGTSFFPAQSVFANAPVALDIFVESVNSYLNNADIRSLSLVLGLFTVETELTADNNAGFWVRSTYWKAGVDHSIVYDVVTTIAERDFRAAHSLYYKGDVVQVADPSADASAPGDLWDQSVVAVYYLYDGSDFSLVGVQNNTAQINSNIVSDASVFRNFLSTLMEEIDPLDSNKIMYSVLFEMLRQNPVCDWFFKTSYIDLHVTGTLPSDAYVKPDEATLVFNAVRDLKPYRTKLRDLRATYLPELEDINVGINESELEKITLIFDRLACNLNDEAAWDTLPWDATATYPEDHSITLHFIGNGIQKCFAIPEIVPLDSFIVQVDSHLVLPHDGFNIDRDSLSICFVVPPPAGISITVMIDSQYEYFSSYSYQFWGNGSKNTQILPYGFTDIATSNIVSAWNGVYQRPATDYTVILAGDTEVSYTATPPVGINVIGTAFGGVMDDVFVIAEYDGDGISAAFGAAVPDQTEDSVLVLVDGVLQSPHDAFVIDNGLILGQSTVIFSVPIATGSKITIFAARFPQFLAAKYFSYNGDGIQRFFAIEALTATNPPRIFVNVSGIEQDYATGDFQLDDLGVTLNVTPVSGDKVDIYVVWLGVGTKLAAVPSPITIQWDWAFWDYADLGRQEYDFAGLIIGDDVTESFSVPIRQVNSSLYNVYIKFFKNGVYTTAGELGLTVDVAKISTGVNIFLSSALGSDTYGAIYVSRGFFEGLEPSFGFQNANEATFDPVPSTYEHFFARLISKYYDPSRDMKGCPTPEERIQTAVEDVFTIAVRAFPGEIPTAPQLPPLLGVEAVAGIGNFTISHANLTGGLEVTTEIGVFNFGTNTVAARLLVLGQDSTLSRTFEPVTTTPRAVFVQGYSKFMPLSATFPTPWTMSAWINPQFTNSGPIMGPSPNVGLVKNGSSYSLLIFVQGLSGYVDADRYYAVTAPIIPNDEWSHVLLSVNTPESLVQLYVNDSQIAITPTINEMPFSAPTSNLNVFGLNDSNDLCGYFEIDGTRAYYRRFFVQPPISNFRGYAAECYFGDYLDISDTSNRRIFITSDGKAVNLASYAGSSSYYFQATSEGGPQSFNRKGAFSLIGAPLIFAPSDPY